MDTDCNQINQIRVPIHDCTWFHSFVRFNRFSQSLWPSDNKKMFGHWRSHWSSFVNYTYLPCKINMRNKLFIGKCRYETYDLWIPVKSETWCRGSRTTVEVFDQVGLFIIFNNTLVIVLGHGQSSLSNRSFVHLPTSLVFGHYFSTFILHVWLRITDEGSVPEMRIWSIS